MVHRLNYILCRNCTIGCTSEQRKKGQTKCPIFAFLYHLRAEHLWNFKSLSGCQTSPCLAARRLEPQLLEDKEDSKSASDGVEDEVVQEEVPIADVAAVPEVISTAASTSLRASAFKHSYSKVQQSTPKYFLQALHLSILAPATRSQGIRAD